MIASRRARIVANGYFANPAFIAGELCTWSNGGGAVLSAVEGTPEGLFQFLRTAGTGPANGAIITGSDSGATCSVFDARVEASWDKEVRTGDEFSFDGEDAWTPIASASAATIILASAGVTAGSFGPYTILRSFTPARKLGRSVSRDSADPNTIFLRNVDAIDASLDLSLLSAYSADVRLNESHAGGCVVVTAAGALTVTLPDATKAGDGWFVHLVSAASSAHVFTVQPLGIDVPIGKSALVAQIGRSSSVSPSHGWITLLAT